MKKLVLFAAIVAAVSFAACSGKANQEAPAEVAEETTIIEEAPATEATTDSAAVEAPATEAPAETPAH